MNNEKIWHLLIEAITQNKVIPIIGDEFFYAEIDGQRMPYIKFLQNKLIEKFPIPNGYNGGSADSIPVDFNMVSDAIRISNIVNSQMLGLMEKSTNIYYEINSIIETNPVLCDERLIQLLEIIDFPIILTTSFLPGIETSLRKKQVICKSYDKSPRVDLQEFEKNVLYYLFGKCNKLDNGYMVTEDDLLDYMHYWHNIDSRPKELCKLLSSKFLLVLGCDYPNWLFRFFWHSIKNFDLSNKNEGIKGVVAGNVLDSDNELSRFLSRIQTHASGNCHDVIDILLSLYPEKHLPEQVYNEENNIDSEKHDIFLSYAHENSKDAQHIAKIFESFGAKVWFDSSSLISSDLYDDIIRRKIEECERFVPVLSSYTETAKRGYFRKEWALSIEENKFRLGSPYIAPIVIDNIDINSTRIPRDFKDAHILNFNDPEFNNSVKKLIRSFR